MMGVAAVILAAGASRRLGLSKQLAMVGGQTLLERAVSVARAAGCAPVIVVLGAEHESVLAGCSLGDAVPVVNANWAEGISASVRMGVKAVRSVWTEAQGVLLMTCDQPRLTAEHLRGLMQHDRVRASRYAGRNGVPAYFPARCFDELMRLQGDVGARDLLQQAEYSSLEGGGLDIDTAEDLEQARLAFKSNHSQRVKRSSFPL